MCEVIVDYLDSLNVFIKYAASELHKGLAVTDSRGVCFVPTLEGEAEKRRFVWKKTVRDPISHLPRDVRDGDTVDPADLRELVDKAVEALNAKTYQLQNEIMNLRVTNLGP
jgi:hypothetical protein